MKSNLTRVAAWIEEAHRAAENAEKEAKWAQQAARRAGEELTGLLSTNDKKNLIETILSRHTGKCLDNELEFNEIVDALVNGLWHNS